MSDPLAPLLDLPGVSEGVDATRAAVDTLLTHRVLRRRSADVSAESSLRGAWISAVLDGADVTLDAVREGVDDARLKGALRTQSAIGALADTWTRAPRQVLARLHALAAADLVPAGELGRPTAGAERLDLLAEVLVQTQVPAVVVAAVVHGEILGLNAFAPVSGVVARVAARLTLVDRGLDPKSLVVIEAGHRDLDYAAALAGYRSGTADGLAEWLGHCAGAVVSGAQETTAICEALGRA